MALIALVLVLAQAASPEPSHRFTMEGYSWGAEFLPDGSRIFMVEALEKGGEVASIVDLHSGKTLVRIGPGEKHAPGYLTLSRDGSTVAGIGDTVYLTAWDAGTGRKLLETWPSGTITRPVLSPDGKIITHSNPKGGDVHLYDVPTGKLLRKLSAKIEQGSDAPMGFSPDGKYLVRTSRNEPVEIWDVSADRPARHLPGGGEVRRPIFSPDGDLLVLIDEGAGTARAFRLADRTPVPLLRDGDTEVIGLAFSPDRRLLAIGTRRDGVKIRELASGTDVLRLKETCFLMAFSPESIRLAACVDRGVLVWRLAPEGAVPLSGERLTELWSQLASSDAGVAFAAVGTLARAGGPAAEMLRRRLAERPLDGDRLSAVIRALGAEDAAERERATDEAANAAHDPALWAAMEKDPSAEVRERAKAVVSRQREIRLGTVALLQRQRAVWVLELMGAREALEEVSRGDARARQAMDSLAALRRLKRG